MPKEWMQNNTRAMQKVFLPQRRKDFSQSTQSVKCFNFKYLRTLRNPFAPLRLSN